MKDQPYPSYKNSNILWIGNIPIHWKIKRIKHTTKVNGRVGWQGLSSNEFIEEGPYLVTGTDFIQGCINWSSCYHVSEERYMKDLNIQLHEGDLLITKDGTIGKTAIVNNMPYKACLNSGIFVTRPITEDYNNLYLYWVLNSTIFDSFINYHTKIGTTISHLYQYIFVDFSFPIPSLQEQQNISAFLDREIQKIDSLINRRKQQTELLKEKRDTLINHVINKGLDPNVPMKDSGVEYLSKIPEHWKKNKIKHLADYINGYPFKPTDWYSEGKEIIRIENLNSNEAIGNRFPEKLDERYLIKKGDILLSWSASLGVYIWDREEGWLNQHIFKVIPKPEIIDNRYYIWLAKWFIIELLKDIHGSTMQHLTKNNFGKFVVYLPPLQEQNTIAAFLNHDTKIIDDLIARIEKQIELLKEKRYTLINYAVRGKIDLRKEFV